MSRSHLSLTLCSLLVLTLACEPAPAASESSPAAPAAPTATAPTTTAPIAQQPVASTSKPFVAPQPRPKTIAEARDRLLAIGTSGDLSKIAALADVERGLEFTHNDKRVRRMRLRPDDPAGMAQLFASKEPSEEIHKVSTLASADTATRTKSFSTDENALTITYRPAAGIKVDFVFERLGDALALVRITT